MIVAFLQNAWFLPTTKWQTIDRYKADPKFRSMILGMSFSGKRLIRTFGDLYQEIHWDNSTEQYGTVSGSKFQADPNHIKHVLRTYHRLRS